MKLILNNKTNEVITIDNFNRNLDIPDSEVLFNIYFSTSNIADAAGMNYLIQYADTPITSYKLYDDDDTEVLNVSSTEVSLTSFNETFQNGYYNANASLREAE